MGGKGTLLFSIANAVNGGLVGAVGPSLPAFQMSTGLGAAGLGRLVLINRLSKLVGTFAWTAYAKQLMNRGTAVPSPRLLLCVCMLMASASAAVIASPALRESKLALQCALGFFGVSYGFTDPGFTLLTIWSLQDSARRQRSHVGYLNAGYTLGALVTPLIVAALLAWGDGGCYPVFYVISAVAALAGVALMASPVASHAGVSPPPAAEKTASTPEGTPLQAKGRAAAAAATDPRRDTIIVASMACVLFCVTGCEHGVATWLPTFAEHVGKVPVQTSAVVSSAYWGGICLGRLVWAAFSHAVSSGWPVLAADGSLMLLSSFCFIAFAQLEAHHVWQLWAGALIMATGFASSLPCAITMPSEAGVVITPGRLLAMNLAGSAGESLMPFLFGAAFERGWYGAFGITLGTLNVVVLAATALARATALAPGGGGGGGGPAEPLDTVEVELEVEHSSVAEGEVQTVSAPPSPGFQR